MGTGHTPGPWEADWLTQTEVATDDINTTLVAIVARDYGPVAWVDLLPWGEETDANAALIARAPELSKENDELRALARDLATVLTLLNVSAEAVHSFGLSNCVPPPTADAFCSAQNAADDVLARARARKVAP